MSPQFFNVLAYIVPGLEHFTEHGRAIQDWYVKLVKWCWLVAQAALHVLLQAITEFLQDMGLTAQQLAARPELVDLIVSYHFAPGRVMAPCSTVSILQNSLNLLPCGAA